MTRPPMRYRVAPRACRRRSAETPLSEGDFEHLFGLVAAYFRELRDTRQEPALAALLSEILGKLRRLQAGDRDIGNVESLAGSTVTLHDVERTIADIETHLRAATEEPTPHRDWVHVLDGLIIRQLRSVLAPTT